MMEYLNTTYQAAATLLPYGYGVSSHKTYQVTDISPPVLSLNPWSIFDKGFTTIMGYSTKDFRFTQGVTPMSTFAQTAAFIATYYLIIFGGREIMRNRPAFRLNTLFMIHNFYLTAISGGLLILFAQQLLPSMWSKGFYDCMCGASGWSQNLLILYYLNYLTKYLELLDTVFLVVKKKPLTFLHTYHHGATALLCYTQLVGETPVSWVPITLNLSVHVVMYWYYFQSARGVKVWWKQYITIFQITQFVLDLAAIYFASWNFFVSTYKPELPHYGTCGVPGTPLPQQTLAATMGCVILSSYLVLFVLFYFATYKKSSPKSSAKKALRRASKTEVPTMEEAGITGAHMIDAVRSTSHLIAEAVKEDSCAVQS